MQHVKEQTGWASKSDVQVLIPENVLNLSIQFIRSLIDQFKIASFHLRPRPFAQVLREDGLNESGARLLRSGNAVDPASTSFESVIEVFSFVPLLPTEGHGRAARTLLSTIDVGYGRRLADRSVRATRLV